LLTGIQPTSAQERFLAPDSLVPLQKVNPNVSSGVAEAVMQAMALHPKDRPSSVAEWRQMFRSSISTAPMETGDTINHNWRLAARENWYLIGLAVVLLVASLWMTFG
jgi:serine/threonine-protein kinase